jgi:hypothetical protein
MRQDDVGRRELLLVCLPTEEAKAAVVNLRMTLRDALAEYMRACAQALEGPSVVFELRHRRFLSPSQTLLDAAVDNGSMLVFGRPEDFAFDGIGEMTAIPIVHSLSEAQRMIGQFDAFTHVPQVFQCSVTAREFEALVSDTAMDQDRHEGLLGGRKLIQAAMRTADRTHQQRMSRVVSRLGPRIQAILGRTSRSETAGSERFTERMRHLLVESDDGRTCHLFSNAAAYHIEPTLQDPDSLVELMLSGEVEVGRITLHTTTTTSGSPAVVSAHEEDTASEQAESERRVQQREQAESEQRSQEREQERSREMEA